MAVRRYLSDALAFTLPAVALWQARREKPVEAIELYTLAKSYPIVAKARWFADIAGRHIASLGTALPADVVAATQKRGRVRDLWGTAEELLIELGE